MNFQEQPDLLCISLNCIHLCAYRCERVTQIVLTRVEVFPSKYENETRGLKVQGSNFIPAPRGRSGRPHLANRTVPCSSGLRLTSRQLCRISSGSGRSMLARGRGALGWDPRGAGTVTARAAPSPRRRGQSAPPTAPAPRPGGVLQPLLPRPGGGAPAGPSPLALPGTPLRPPRPAPHGSESAPPPAAPAGAL